jgi:DNA-binding NtrC family response regulator
MGASMRESESSPRGVRGRVVIADDTPSVARLAARVLVQAGYECEICASAPAALAAVEQRGADVVLADLAGAGRDLLAQLQNRFPAVALIALTFNPGIGSAIAAMRQGAFDYLVKPLDEDELGAIVSRAIELRKLERENARLRRRLEMAEAAAAFVAESAAGKNLLALVRRVASTDSVVLIEGESGTGKELLARMLHHWSERSEGPFVTVTCKGSFVATTVGDVIRNGSAVPVAGPHSIPLKRALGGTLFLDEIAEAGPAIQAELVRILDEGEAAGRGAGSWPDVRIIAGSSRTLRIEAEAGRFRTDLLFRLSAVPIRIPPLRERREDILALARRFLSAYTARTGRRLSLTSDAERELLAYRWPGNVRELRNAIERAALMTGADFVMSKALDLGARAAEPERLERLPAEPARNEGIGAQRWAAPEADAAAAVASAPAAGEPGKAAPAAAAAPQPHAAVEADAAASGTLQECLDEAARARIRAALEAAKGNRSQAARTLDVDGTTLGRLIKRLGL